MRHLLVGATTAALLTSCTGPPAGPLVYRGHFTLVTSRSVSDFAEVGLQPRVLGRACFSASAWLGDSDEAIQAAVEDAISQRADANALLLAQIDDVGRCIEVQGWPVRHE